MPVLITSFALLFFTFFAGPAGADANAWSISKGANSGWQQILSGYSIDWPIKDLGFGDFDGDGRTDVFVTNANVWLKYSGGANAAERINSSNAARKNLAFGDFNGDGKTDVFTSVSGEWRVSYSGTGRWTKLNSSGVKMKDLAFGDFNGDGKTDVFTVMSDGWKVSNGGTGRWRKKGNSKIALNKLGFADFDGDGKTDIFRTSRGNWYVAWSGDSGWKKLATSGVELKNIRFGDFNGDGKTDVFTVMSDGWKVSFGGTGRWTQMANSRVPLRNLRFGDFDGDGRTDAFRLSLPRPPVNPTDLDVSITDTDNARLTWVDNANNEDGFMIHAKGTRTGYTDKDKDKKLDSANTTSTVIKNLSDGYEYCFAVSAYNSGGASGRSRMVCKELVNRAPPTPPKQTGYAEIAVANCNSTYTRIHVWVREHGSSQAFVRKGTVMYSGSQDTCRNKGNYFTMDLIDELLHEFAFVATELTGCPGNNPEYGACRILSIEPVLGDKGGEIYPATVQ